MYYLYDPQDLNPAFPFNIFEDDIPNTKTSISQYHHIPDITALHAHECLELNLVSSGEGIYYVDDSICHCNRGDVMFFNNFEYHGAIGMQSFRLKVIVFDQSLIWSGNPLDYQYLKTFYEWKNDFRHQLKEGVLSDEIAVYVAEIQKEWRERSAGYQLVIKSLLMKILAVLYRGFEKNEQTSSSVLEYSSKYHKLENAIQYINTNFSEDITLQKLAESVHLNPNYFSNCFTAIMNCSPFEYLNKKRIEFASKELVTTTKSVTDIAMGAGFHNISYFNRVFKNLMKLSPTDFRKGKRMLDFLK